MDFKEVMESRRSIRDYDKRKKIPTAILQELFRLVSLTPSSYNLQPWKFIVVQNEANKRRLRKCANNQKHVGDAFAVVIVLGSTNAGGHADIVSADRMKKGTMDATKKKSFDAAVARISTDRRLGKDWTLRSTSLAAMTLMLAATHLGLASCPLEGFDPKAVRAEFSIPEEYEVVMFVTLGYASTQPPQRPMRFGVDDMVFYEKFQ
ncbi:nitroreductase family protein [Candidatus Woesearchaeota archaeon]|nr:nitroreductase family protein [Candidatus Woesearchaeota archaeon]